MEGIVGECGVRNAECGIGEDGNLREEVGADGDFAGAVFGEGDADGVAEAVAEEGADADGGFDAAVFAFASFGDAEVDGIIPVGAFLLEARDKEAVALDHHLGVG